MASDAAKLNFVMSANTRFWLVIVLALLLPFRGAVAAAMLCPVAVPNQQAAASHGGGHGHHAHHAKEAARADAPASQHAAHGHPGGGVADKCNTCSAFCSVTPLPTTEARLAEPPLSFPDRFPEVSTPPPGFVPTGLERPPRAA